MKTYKQDIQLCYPIDELSVPFFIASDQTGYVVDDINIIFNLYHPIVLLEYYFYVSTFIFKSLIILLSFLKHLYKKFNIEDDCSQVQYDLAGDNKQ